MSKQPNHFLKPFWDLTRLKKAFRRNPAIAASGVMENEHEAKIFAIDVMCARPTTQYLEIDEDAYNYIDSLKIESIDGSFINLPPSLKISTPHWGADIAWMGTKEFSSIDKWTGGNGTIVSPPQRWLMIRAEGDFEGISIQDIPESALQDYLNEDDVTFKVSRSGCDVESTESQRQIHKSRIAFVMKLAILLQTDGFTDHIIKYRSKVKSLKGRAISTFAAGTFEVHDTEFWVAPFVRQLRAARYYQGAHANRPRGSRFTMVKGHIRTRVRVAA